MTSSDLTGWTTGQSPTLLEALGISSLTASQAALSTSLPQVSTDSTKASATPAAKGALKQYARKLLRDDGFGGQFDALNSIIMAESGWSTTVKNATSGAYGIAQALGHGTSSTQGTQSNAYGGYGLTTKEARQANSGDGYMQLTWMINYCKSAYGSPNAAWTFHKANGWY